MSNKQKDEFDTTERMSDVIADAMEFVERAALDYDDLAAINVLRRMRELVPHEH